MSFGIKPQTSTVIRPNTWMVIFLFTACCMTGLVTLSHAKKGGNVLAIQNDSGQFALVKTVGPTRAVAKIPLDQKKTIRLAPGEYYILVRIGFAPKEYIYTKGEPFTIKEEEDKFSLTTVTLHRIISGMKNPHEVSGEEFEHYKISRNKESRE